MSVDNVEIIGNSIESTLLQQVRASL